MDNDTALDGTWSHVLPVGRVLCIRPVKIADKDLVSRSGP
jgi:hypothetical protein